MKATEEHHAMLDAAFQAPWLSQWEEDFASSLYDQIEESGTLSEKQAAVLEKIYEKI